MKKNLPIIKYAFAVIFLLTFLSHISVAQTVTIDANAGQSGNIVLGPNNNHVSENIYTEAEVGAANFVTPGTAINRIQLSVFTLGSVTNVSNFKLYLKEVPLNTTTFTTGVYNTAGYTLVFSGSVNFNRIGWVGIDLTTPFVRTAGNNLQLLIERSDNLAHGAFQFNATRGNETGAGVLSSRRENLATVPISGTTSLNTLNAFRPRIQLIHVSANDARIAQVYTLGKLPIPFAAPAIVSTAIINSGSNTLNNLSVNLTVSGANTFNDIKNITTLAAGDTAIVSFAPFSPTNTGTNNVNVTLPSDDYNGDNSFDVVQQVTINSYNYSLSKIAAGATGFSILSTNPAGTGDFSAMFTTSSPTSVNQVGVSFITGGQPFKLVIWDKSGTGKPGAVLWESTTQTSTAGVFTLPISPAIAINDTFYVGIRQLNPVNIQFAYQSENPARPNTFFYAQPTGNNSWIDLAPTSPFRFMIEPRLTVANDVGIAKISNPVAVTNVDNCGLVPEAVITNFGSQNQVTPFDVTYLIRQSGTTVYNDTKSISLNSGVSQKVAFAPFTGSVTGADSSIVYTSLTTDAATNNDTVVNRFNTSVFSYTDSLANSGGYSYANSTICAIPSPNRPTYNWSNLATTEINWAANGDDNVYDTPVAIPFPFKFFGNTFNQFWIGSNGWISFTDQNALSAAIQRTPAGFPSAAGIDNYIAGALTDLDVTTATYADAHTYIGGDAAQMVVTYLHAHLKGSATDYITFQIILKATGDILIQYDDARSSVPVSTDITNFCAVGIENTGSTKGLQYRLNGSGGSMFGSPLALLFVAPQVALPVSLSNFTAQRNNSVNKISWTTTQEINTSYFTVERSNNGRNFSPLGKITAAGNSDRLHEYTFTDNAPFKGINYYRLAITDITGIVKYSIVKTVRNAGTADVSIYPMPVKNALSVVINADAADRGTITITGLNGQSLQRQNINLSSGKNNIQVNTSALSSGVYVIKINLQGDMIIKKFNKQ